MKPKATLTRRISAWSNDGVELLDTKETGGDEQEVTAISTEFRRICPGCRVRVELFATFKETTRLLEAKWYEQ